MKPSLTGRLRVALVVSSLRLGGAEKQFVYMAGALFTAGIEVQIFYLGSDGHYESVLREMGLPLRRIYRPKRPWRMLGELTRTLRVFRPDIVLVSQFSDILFGGIAGRPWRENAVEALLKGKTLGPDLSTDIPPRALANAAPLKYNAMKIEMARGLLASGLAQLSAPA